MPQGERIVYAVALIAALGFAGAAAVEFAKDRAAARDAALDIIPGAVIRIGYWRCPYDN